jgi:SSS family solute:Na+ symporter
VKYTPFFAASGATAAPQAILTGLDWAAIAAYFGVLLCVAWWVIKRRKDTAEDYFLAGRNLSWWVIGASIFASNIGSEHIVGLAGSGAKSGVALAHYELQAWCLLVLAWVFVPFYARSLVFTMPEFLERRFSAGSRYVLSVVSMITFVVTKIAVGIYAGGVVFSTLLPEMRVNMGGMDIGPFWIGSVLVVVMTGLYTMLGGMRAVAYNDAVQVLVLIGGSATLTFYGLHQLGGWHELRRLCGSDMFNLWKPLIPAGVQSSWAPVLEKNAAGDIVKEAWYFNGNYPWLGMAICAPVIGLWYWCTDQYIVQRALGAPNQQTARRGSIFAAFLKMFPVYLFIVPGMICFALAKKGVAPGLEPVYDPATGHAAAAAQGAFPLMVAHLLPPGLRGIVVAGLLSALMGSLAGVFNACSTLFTVDFYEKFRPGAAQHQIVRMGRIATATMVVMAIAWIPVVKGRNSLYEYLQSVQGYLAPPVFVVFFFGVFWKRLNAQGCFWSMVAGFVIGLARMIIDTPVALFNTGPAPFEYPKDSFLWIINTIPFQYFSVLITIVCAVVMVVVSYMTAPPDDKKIAGLTFATASDENKSETRASWGAGEVAASVFVLVCIMGAYLYFTG